MAHKVRCRDQTPLEENDEGRGSVPCPGDTLPWNLSKHQRVKRSKSASGDVLDPAERAVIRIAGELGPKNVSFTFGCPVHTSAVQGAQCMCFENKGHMPCSALNVNLQITVHHP